MQNGNLLEHLSVTDNMRLQQVIAGKGRLGLAHRTNALPSQLSGGESARAGLALALSPAPALLICDEPTAEVDADAEQDIIALLRQQAGRHCRPGRVMIDILVDVAAAGRAFATGSTQTIALQSATCQVR